MEKRLIDQYNELANQFNLLASKYGDLSKLLIEACLKTGNREFLQKVKEIMDRDCLEEPNRDKK